MRTPLALVLAVLGGAIVLAGCGGGSPGPRLPAAGFRTEVTQACADARARTARIARPRSPGDVPLFLRRAARVQAREVTRLKALRPPAAFDARWSAQTQLLDRQLAVVQGLAGVKDGQGDALAAVARRRATLRSLRAATARGWRGLGLPGCAG